MNEETDDPPKWATVAATIVGLPIISAALSPVIFILTFPLLLYKAWVVVILWGWFVVPVFHLPPLELGYACGLLLIWHLLNATEQDPRKKKEEPGLSVAEFIALILLGFIGPTCSLGFGWLVKAVLC